MSGAACVRNVEQAVRGQKGVKMASTGIALMLNSLYGVVTAIELSRATLGFLCPLKDNSTRKVASSSKCSGRSVGT